MCPFIFCRWAFARRFFHLDFPPSLNALRRTSPLRRVSQGSYEQPKGKEPEMAKENERKEAKERKRKQDGGLFINPLAIPRAHARAHTRASADCPARAAMRRPGKRRRRSSPTASRTARRTLRCGRGTAGTSPGGGSSTRRTTTPLAAGRAKCAMASPRSRRGSARSTARSRRRKATRQAGHSQSL